MYELQGCCIRYGPVCMDAKTPQALKTLASIRPDVKQHSRMGMDVR